MTQSESQSVSEQETSFSNSSNSTIVDRLDDHEEITKLKTELVALKSFVIEQLHFIKQSIREPKEHQKNIQQDAYISSLLEQVDYLKDENKTKNSIIKSLTNPNSALNSKNYLRKEHDDSNLKSNDGTHEKSLSAPNYADDHISSISSDNDVENINDNENINKKTDGTDPKVPSDDSNVTKRRDKTKNSKDKKKKIKNNNSNDKRKDSKFNSNDRTDRNINTSSSSSSSASDKKEKVFIIGDSMVKKVNGFLLTKKVNHKCLVKVRSFSGAKVRCLHDYVKPTLRDFNPDHIILHVGTNDLNSEKTSSQIANSIIELHNSLKTIDNEITVSLIVPRADNLNNKAIEVNNRLINMCNERNINFIDHKNDVQPERHINESKVHLNRYGTIVFAKKFSDYISNLY